MRDKSHDGLNKTAIVSGVDKKRGHNREKNCVIELSMLKKEVDDEIRRDRKNLLHGVKSSNKVN